MRKNFKIEHRQVVTLVSIVVGLYGVFIIGATLIDQFSIHRLRIVNSFTIDVHLLFGLAFVYLSLLLSRRKRNALLLALVAFFVLLIDGVTELILHPLAYHFNGLIILRYMLLPLVIMAALLMTRSEFKVKSDQQAFRSSVKLAVIVLFITLVYGVAGFMLMDESDFHQDIGITSALHHTIDQFDLTTTQPLQPHTRRAKLFMDSLSFVSVAAIGVLVVSLFQPVRARLSDQSEYRERLRRLMDSYGAQSEDFFKLWPKDKHYYFSENDKAALAYRPTKGVALVLGDPAGDKAAYASLLQGFSEMCWANDWQPALIHVDGNYADFYRDNGFQLQLVGQEASVSINKFCSETAKNKYFRNIKNRFEKEDIVFEFLDPPHHAAIVDRLQVISDEWLEKPGRTERGFVMGYYSSEYLQQCRLAVVRDAAQTILGFMNLVPSESFNKTEVTYDMLRSVKDAPPNLNDYLLYQLLHYLNTKGYESINLGLSPLVGLDEASGENALISRVMRFAYTNGDRIYSFSGLHRFKEKYDPVWEDRFLGYKGGVAGFSKMLNALLSAMNVRRLKS